MKRQVLIKAIQKNFECQRCNLCCIQPGFVYVTEKDIARIAKYLNISPDDFKSHHCRKEDDFWVLEGDHDEPCVYLDPDKGCKIHEAKPSQCRSFPHHWRDDDAFEYCQGIAKIKSEDR